MEVGPFAAGELMKVAPNSAAIGSFLLTASGSFWIIGLDAGRGPQPLAVPLSGDRPFVYPNSLQSRNGLRIVGRSSEITVGAMLGNEEPLPGDLGIGAKGQIVVSVKLVESGGSADLEMSLETGNQVTDVDRYSYTWIREWRLDLVSAKGDRRVTLIDRLKPV